MNYYEKYKKYKKQYLELKKLQIGGTRQIKTYTLKIPKNIWQYKGTYPSDVVDLAGKIWYIKKTIRYKTYLNHKLKEEKVKIPQGLTVLSDVGLNGPKVTNDIEYLFENYKKLNIPHDRQDSRGLTYLFTRPAKKKTTSKNETITSKETLEILKKESEPVYNLVKKIIEKVCDYYKVEESLLLKNAQIVLLKYEHNSGIWLHIDNITRYDQGPIITFSIGPKKIYYDMTPAIVSEEDIKKNDYKPFRIELTDDDILIMDGPSRMEWAHGLPYNMNYTGIKYTIMLKCDKFLEKKVKHNDILDIDIIQSGLSK